MEKREEFLKQRQFRILKEQEALQETKTNNQVSSEALIAVDLEVNDAIYLENSSDNEYMPGKTRDRKSKTVQRKHSIDEAPSELHVPGQPKNDKKQRAMLSFHIYQYELVLETST